MPDAHLYFKQVACGGLGVDDDGPSSVQDWRLSRKMPGISACLLGRCAEPSQKLSDSQCV